MSHFAKVVDGIVIEVIVAEQDHVDTLPGTWIQTSYNTRANKHELGGTPLRGNYAAVGYTYDKENDVFYSQSPFKGWILDQNTWTWQPPVPAPTDDKIYYWDDETTSWKERTY